METQKTPASSKDIRFRDLVKGALEVVVSGIIALVLAVIGVIVIIADKDKTIVGIILIAGAFVALIVGIATLFSAAGRAVKAQSEAKAVIDQQETEPADSGNFVAAENPSEHPVLRDQTGDEAAVEVRAGEFLSGSGNDRVFAFPPLSEVDRQTLEKILFEKSGKSWDEAVLQGVTADDLSREALDLYRDKAVRKGRRSKSQVRIPDELLLEDLSAVDPDGSLYRGTVLFFHPDPEQYVTGAYIKIGYFGSLGNTGGNQYNDVVYHDDVHGPLIRQIDEAMELIYTKYLKAYISYDGVQRVENYLWPKEAFREVLLNAINNKKYQSGNPIQIKIYDDRVVVFNEGEWPSHKLSVKDVYKEHNSYPVNPKLAKLFYESGDIEAWGSGFIKIKEECARVGAPLPVIEAGGPDTPEKGVVVICNASDTYLALQRGEGKRTDSVQDDAETEMDAQRLSVERMLQIVDGALTEREKEIMLPLIDHLRTMDTVTTNEAAELVGKSNDTALRYLKKLTALDVLEQRGSTRDAYFVRK